MEPIDTKPVEIHSVLFRPDGQVEVTYAEKDEITPVCSTVRTVVLAREKFEGDIQDLELALFELVDEGLLAARLYREEAADKTRKAGRP